MIRQSAPTGSLLQAGVIGCGTSLVLGLTLAPHRVEFLGLPELMEIVLIAPVTEELLFRGYLLWSAHKAFGYRSAIVGSSVLFGVLHYTNGWASMCVAIALGLYFAIVTFRTRSFYPSVIGHILFNAAQVVLAMRPLQS